MVVTDTPRSIPGKFSVGFACPAPDATPGAPPADVPPRSLLRTPSTLRGKSLASTGECSVQVFLRIRPPQEPGGDVDRTTGLRTFEVLPAAGAAAGAAADAIGPAVGAATNGGSSSSSGGGSSNGTSAAALPAAPVLATPSAAATVFSVPLLTPAAGPPAAAAAAAPTPSDAAAGATSTAATAAAAASGPTTVRSQPPATSRVAGRAVKEFSFSRVFAPGSAQADIYDATTKPLVADLLRGRSGLVFAYGMTNAGKTYTTMGERDAAGEKTGILPRALQDIFEGAAVAEAAGGVRPGVSMSFLEIYNENVYDLLATSKSEDEWLQTREALKLQDRLGKIEPRNLSRHAVDSPQAAIELLTRGNRNRQVASTKLNEDSSRSHSVCSIEIDAVTLPAGSDSADSGGAGGSAGAAGAAGVAASGAASGAGGATAAEPSVLWIVDLAGSERSARTGTDHRSDRQKEANNINLSLTTLWRCLQLMRRNQIAGIGGGAAAGGGGGGGGGAASSSGMSTGGGSAAAVVPFRESKLTHLFMNHLSGRNAGKTVMIVNINPSVGDFDENQHVLANSAIAQEVKTSRDAKNGARQAALLNAGGYGYDGRRLLRRKSRGGGRRSIHKPKAPMLTPQKQLIRALSSRSVRSEAGSDAAGEAELSGAESDGVLMGERERMVLEYEDREEKLKEEIERTKQENETLKREAKRTREAEKEVRELSADVAAIIDAYEARLAELAEQFSAVAAAAAAAAATGSAASEGGGGGGDGGGGVAATERVVATLEARLRQREAEMVSLREAHEAELREVEAEFEGFCEENGLNEPRVVDPLAALRKAGEAEAALTNERNRLKEEVRCAKREAVQWRREAESYKEQLAGAERRLSPPKPLNRPGPLSPLSSREAKRLAAGRLSTGSNSNARDEAENTEVIGSGGGSKGNRNGGILEKKSTSRGEDVYKTPVAKAPYKPTVAASDSTGSPRQSIVAISRRSSVLRVSHSGGGRRSSMRLSVAAAARRGSSSRRSSAGGAAGADGGNRRHTQKMERVVEKEESFFDKVRAMLLRMTQPGDAGRTTGRIKKRAKSLRPNRKPLDDERTNDDDDREDGDCYDDGADTPNRMLLSPPQTALEEPEIVEDYVPR